MNYQNKKNCTPYFAISVAFLTAKSQIDVLGYKCCYYGKKVIEELLACFARLFISEEILEHFEVKSLKEDQGIIWIELVEKEDLAYVPKEIVRLGKVVKDGHMNPIEPQSFTAQGKEVFKLITLDLYTKSKK